MGDIIPFEFEGVPVRVVDQNGEPWWVLADICRILELSNPSAVASKLDDDVKETLISNEGTRGDAPTIINESGLYDVLDRSRKPAAKRFRRWKNHEVVPSIRKKGYYVMPGVDKPASTAFVKQVWEEQTKLIGIQFATHGAALERIEVKVDAHTAQIADLANRIKPPKAPFTDNDWEIWRQVIKTVFNGLDPSGSGRHVLDKNGNWLSDVTADHHNREKGGHKNGWPVPSDINEKLKDIAYRDSKRHRFTSFQDEVDRLFPHGPRNWLGRRKLRGRSSRTEQHPNQMGFI